MENFSQRAMTSPLIVVLGKAWRLILVYRKLILLVCLVKKVKQLLVLNKMKSDCLCFLLFTEKYPNTMNG